MNSFGTDKSMVSKNGKSYFTIDFSQVTPSGLKEFSAAFKRNKLEVIEIVASNKATTKDGLKTKKAQFVFGDEQAITLFFTENGDLSQVKLNTKFIPLEHQETLNATCKEIALKVKANEARFAKLLEKKAVAVIDTSSVKTGVKTLRNQIDEATKALNSSTANLDGAKKRLSKAQKRLDNLNTVNTELTAELVQLKQKENDLAKQLNDLQSGK